MEPTTIDPDRAEMAGYRWAGGDAYEAYIGRWSRPVAGQFLDWLAVPAGRRWIDVGCGTGALSGQILDRCAPGAIVGVVPSADFVRHPAPPMVRSPLPSVAAM